MAAGRHAGWPGKRRMPAAALLLALLLPLACAPSGSPGDPGPADAPADRPDAPADTPAPADALADAPDAPADLPAADAAPEARDWTLPPCYRACDRLTACGVEACLGYDWAGAGGVFEACFTACDDAFAAAVLGAPGCPEARALSAAALADTWSRCDTNPCDPVCDAFAACLVDRCEALEEAHAPSLVSGCHDWCTAGAAAWVQETPCPDLVEALSESDPAFAEGCHGPVAPCPGPDLCDPWGVKLSGCVVAHCNGNADAYGPGLETLLSWVCQHDAQCGSAAEVQGVLAADVTCDGPALATLGHDAPFTGLCEGTLGVPSADVADACDPLAACPGAEWLGGIPGCMAFLAILHDVVPRVQCLRAAADCTAAYACLEGV